VTTAFYNKDWIGFDLIGLDSDIKPIGTRNTYIAQKSTHRWKNAKDACRIIQR